MWGPFPASHRSACPATRQAHPSPASRTCQGDPLQALPFSRCMSSDIAPVKFRVHLQRRLWLLVAAASPEVAAVMTAAIDMCNGLTSGGACPPCHRCLHRPVSCPACPLWRPVRPARPPCRPALPIPRSCHGKLWNTQAGRTDAAEQFALRSKVCMSLLAKPAMLAASDPGVVLASRAWAVPNLQPRQLPAVAPDVLPGPHPGLQHFGAAHHHQPPE